MSITKMMMSDADPTVYRADFMQYIASRESMRESEHDKDFEHMTDLESDLLDDVYDNEPENYEQDT